MSQKWSVLDLQWWILSFKFKMTIMASWTDTEILVKNCTAGGRKVWKVMRGENKRRK